MGGVSFKKSWCDKKSTGGDVSDATSPFHTRSKGGRGLVELSAGGHCVSGVLSDGSQTYLGGDDVISAVALRGISPRSMGPESWGTVTDMEVYRFQAEGHSVFSPKVTSKVFPGVTLTFTDRIS